MPVLTFAAGKALGSKHDDALGRLCHERTYLRRDGGAGFKLYDNQSLIRAPVLQAPFGPKTWVEGGRTTLLLTVKSNAANWYFIAYLNRLEQRLRRLVRAHAHELNLSEAELGPALATLTVLRDPPDVRFDQRLTLRLPPAAAAPAPGAQPRYDVKASKGGAPIDSAFLNAQELKLRPTFTVAGVHCRRVGGRVTISVALDMKEVRILS